MSEVEQIVYDCLIEARNTADNAADLEVARQIQSVIKFMVNRAESRRTGEPTNGE